MTNHPFISHQIAAARQRDLLTAAAYDRLARAARLPGSRPWTTAPRRSRGALPTGAGEARCASR